MSCVIYTLKREFFSVSYLSYYTVFCLLNSASIGMGNFNPEYSELENVLDHSGGFYIHCRIPLLIIPVKFYVWNQVLQKNNKTSGTMKAKKDWKETQEWEEERKTLERLLMRQ